MVHHSALSTPVIKGKRRGFGLFNDDDDEGDEIEAKILRSLSANRAGLETPAKAASGADGKFAFILGEGDGSLVFFFFCFFLFFFPFFFFLLTFFAVHRDIALVYLARKEFAQVYLG